MKSVKFFVAILVVALLSSLELLAQPGGGGGGRRGGMGEQRPQMNQTELSPEELVSSTGLFEIELDEVLKKCKISDGDRLSNVISLIEEYQSEYNTISTDLQLQIDSLYNSEVDMSQMTHSAMGGTDGSQMQRPQMSESMKERMKLSQTIRERTLPMHQALSLGMKECLTDKELNKWDSYYAKICKANNFSLKERRANSGASSDGSQMRERSGGMRGGRMN